MSGVVHELQYPLQDSYLKYNPLSQGLPEHTHFSAPTKKPPASLRP